MAKMSVRIRNRAANAEYVVSSMDENRDSVVQGLMTHNQWLPQELRMDEATLRAFLEWMANTVRYKTASMVGAEGAYVDEQGDDPAVRERRDEAVPAVGLCMSQTRSKVSAVFGEVGLSTYGLRAVVPRAPAELAAYASTSANLMRKHPRTAPDPTGGTVDTVALAEAIDQALAPLSTALSDLVVEQRQLQTAMIRRDTEVKEWNEVYVNATAAFAWLARMARQHEVAQRVRPSARRARGEELAPELPANGSEPVDPARPAPDPVS